MLSLRSLREDLEVSQRAVSHWLREVDFLVTAEGRPWFALECKISDRTASPALRYFGDRLQIPWLYQLLFPHLAYESPPKTLFPNCL